MFVLAITFNFRTQNNVLKLIPVAEINKMKDTNLIEKPLKEYNTRINYCAENTREAMDIANALSAMASKFSAKEILCFARRSEKIRPSNKLF